MASFPQEATKLKQLCYFLTCYFQATFLLCDHVQPPQCTVRAVERMWASQSCLPYSQTLSPSFSPWGRSEGSFSLWSRHATLDRIRKKIVSPDHVGGVYLCSVEHMQMSFAQSPAWYGEVGERCWGQYGGAHFFSPDLTLTWTGGWSLSNLTWNET